MHTHWIQNKKMGTLVKNSIQTDPNCHFIIQIDSNIQLYSTHFWFQIARMVALNAVLTLDSFLSHRFTQHTKI